MMIGLEQQLDLLTMSKAKRVEIKTREEKEMNLGVSNKVRPKFYQLMKYLFVFSQLELVVFVKPCLVRYL